MKPQASVIVPDIPPLSTIGEVFYGVENKRGNEGVFMVFIRTPTRTDCGTKASL